jgi:hypothetical protein
MTNDRYVPTYLNKFHAMESDFAYLVGNFLL